ncbi:MAG: histidine kinase [Xanthomonadaceae bacterium]|nr:histidine kinase [Xanthomonadaceae bacterium]
MQHGLPEKLRVAFLLQVVAAVLVIVAGGYFALETARQDVAARALHDEASYFWQQRAMDPTRDAPDGAILHGYAVPIGASAAALPASLRALQPGLHDLPDLMVLVERQDDVQLYLTYPRSKIDRIAVRLVLAPILLALMAVLLSSWLTYRLARRLTSPLLWLANEVRRWDPRDPDTSVLAPDKLPAEAGLETRQLAGALQRMGDRTRSFMHRERDFTRDASHELRTPLTVIRVASDLMQSDPDLPERAHRSLARIQRAGRDMEAVIDAFLLLARESEVEPQREDFQVRDVVDEEVEKVRPLLAGKPIELSITQRASPYLHASPRVLGVMLGNLLANACSFTARGRIEITILADRVVVRDTGIGMGGETLRRAFEPFFRGDPANPAGRGMGLSIVRQLGERFGWPVNLESAPGQGTTATIRFSG